MNNDFNNLKTSTDGIPTYESLIPYILEVLKDKKEVRKKDIQNMVIEFLSIPKEITDIKYPDYPEGDGVLINRFSFALSDLYKANGLARPKRGVYKITSSGSNLLQEYGDELNTKVLKNQPPYIKYMEELEIRNKKSGISVTSEEESEEMNLQNVEKIVTSMKNIVATELLEKVRESNPIFFEKLVVKLLVAMGYSGKDGEASVTNQSNDGGIDGIINQDPLGTSTVYIQAKRYKEDNIVGRGAIQSFYGALAGVRADRGVFITTSNYSKGALDYAKSQGIVLINGIELTDLMIRYGVGVEPIRKLKVYRIDNDYFEEEV
ncbi:Mrr restriction system protein [Brachybacterium faecium]|nr:Mrr restriction system protein [Brachybacterium faecium]